MHSKKAALATVIETLIGVVIASIVIIFVALPIISAGYRLLFPQPDYATLQGFERLWTAIDSVTEKETFYIPVQIMRGFKITTSDSDKNCVENCICLCKMQYGTGCLQKIYSEHCAKNKIFMDGELWVPSVFLLEVSKTDKGIYLKGKYSEEAETALLYEECIKKQDHFTRFPVDETSCLLCTDTLQVGDSSFKDVEVGCERYSYYTSTETEYSAGTSTPTGQRIIKQLSLPEFSSYIELAKTQCELDPCKLKESKKLKCEWDEKTNSCKGTAIEVSG